MDAILGYLGGLHEGWAVVIFITLGIFLPEISFSGIKIKGFIALLITRTGGRMTKEILDKVLTFSEKHIALREHLVNSQVEYIDDKNMEMKEFTMSAFIKLLEIAYKKAGKEIVNLRASDYYKDFARIIDFMLSKHRQVGILWIQRMNTLGDEEELLYLQSKKAQSGLTNIELERIKEIEKNFDTAVFEKVRSILVSSSTIIDEQYPQEHYFIEREELRMLNKQIAPEIMAHIESIFRYARELKMEYLKDKRQLISELEF